MKSIYNLIITIILMAIILTIYFKIDDITDFVKNIFVTEKEIIIKDSNEYKRNYSYVTVKESTDFIPLNKYNLIDIYYSVLNNGWDKFTFYCPDEYKNCLEDVNDIANDEDLVNKISGYVNPFNSFSDVSTTISIFGEINIRVDKKYTDNEIKIVNDRVNSIYEELNIDTIPSVENKIKAIQNYIIKNTTYDNEMADNEKSPYLSDTAYGVLVQGYGICSGYTDAMALFLDKLNIPNLKIVSENHIWNLVYINDEWKHLDVTWNDNEKAHLSSNNFFLIDNDTLKKLDPSEHNYDANFYLEILQH